MKILIVDDSKERHYGFRGMYYPQHQIKKAFNVNEALDIINDNDFDLIHLDHDLMDFEHFTDGRRPVEHTGMDICCYLIKTNYTGEVIIHSWNTPASLKMKKMFEEAGIKVSYQPYKEYTPEQNVIDKPE